MPGENTEMLEEIIKRLKNLGMKEELQKKKIIIQNLPLIKILIKIQTKKLINFKKKN